VGGTVVIGWVGDIEHLTLRNETFRTVLLTGVHMQLTVMRLASGEDIGKEVHPDRDQFIRIEEGQARYSPPEHPDGAVHRTKADAEAAEHAG
jgi:hypothetical protein